MNLNLDKRLILVLGLVTSLVTTAFAQTKGDVRDGVNAQLDASSISDLLAWAQNSQSKLEKGLVEASKLPQNQKRSFLRGLVDSVVEKSADMREELLMRSVLRRARNFDALIGPVLQADSSGEVLAVDLLTDAAKWAMELYPTEKAYLAGLEEYYRSRATSTAPKNLEFADLGLKSTRKVLNTLYLSPSVEASLSLLKETMTYLYNDINRDLMARRQMAPALLSILEQAVRIGIMDEKGVSVPTVTWLDSLKGLSVTEKLNLERSIKTFLDNLLGAPVSEVVDEYLTKVNRRAPGLTGGNSTPGSQVLNTPIWGFQKATLGLGAGYQKSAQDSKMLVPISFRYNLLLMDTGADDYPIGITVSAKADPVSGYAQAKSDISVAPFLPLANSTAGVTSNVVNGQRYSSAWTLTGVGGEYGSETKPFGVRAAAHFGRYFFSQGVQAIDNGAQFTRVPGLMHGLAILAKVETDKSYLSVECRAAQAQKYAQFAMCALEFEKLIFHQMGLQIGGQKLINSTPNLFQNYMPTQISVGVSVNQNAIRFVTDRMFN